MIYTVGHEETYRKAIAESPIGYITKRGQSTADGYIGGVVFRSVDEAESFIRDQGQEGAWSVFGVQADWDIDTYLSQVTWERHLLRDARIVLVDAQGNPIRKPRGFAAMSPDKRRAIASMGGKAAHTSGTAHKFTSDEARAAGQKGGTQVSRSSAHMSRIGQIGGRTVSQDREHMRRIGRKGGQQK